MICIDNSEWMRNGDYSPSRFQAQADAVNLICGAKTQVFFYSISILIFLIISYLSYILLPFIFFIKKKKSKFVVKSGEYSGNFDNGGKRGSRIGHSHYWSRQDFGLHAWYYFWWFYIYLYSVIFNFYEWMLGLVLSLRMNLRTS